MCEAEMMSLIGEDAECESRSDEEEYFTYFDEERRRVALRGPARRLIMPAEHI